MNRGGRLEVSRWATWTSRDELDTSQSWVGLLTVDLSKSSNSVIYNLLYAIYCNLRIILCTFMSEIRKRGSRYIIIKDTSPNPSIAYLKIHQSIMGSISRTFRICRRHLIGTK